MDSLQSILPKVLHRRGLQRHAEASRIVFVADRWIKANLPTVADALAVAHCRDGLLTICSDHSIAAQECHQALPLLLDHLRRECKDGAPGEIRVIRER